MIRQAVHVTVLIINLWWLHAQLRGAASPSCLGKPYASKLILSQTDPSSNAAPMCFAAFVLAISVCQPGKHGGVVRVALQQLVWGALQMPSAQT
jgi:hypothetical protein